MSLDGQGTKCPRNVAENFNRLSRAHVRYRRPTTDRQTDGRAIAYSEREREFTSGMLGLGLKANFLGLGGHRLGLGRGLEDFGLVLDLGLATLALAF